MPHYRYFLADRTGTTHAALSAMEAAGRQILQAFADLDKVKDVAAPVQIILNGEIKALATLPSSVPWHVADELRRSMIDQFRSIKDELAELPGIVPTQPVFATTDGRSRLTFPTECTASIGRIARHAQDLGVHPIRHYEV